MTDGIVYTGYARDSRFYVKWWRTGTWNDQNDCGSNIHWELHLQNGNKWYTNALGINVIEINGQQVYGSNKWSNYKTDGDYVLASGDLGVIHDNEGNKQITVRILGWFYQHGEKSGQQDFQLDKISRAPEFLIQPYQLTADDEEIMKIYYKPNKRISSVQYKSRMVGQSWEYSDWQNIEVISGDWHEGCIFKVPVLVSSIDGTEAKNELQMRIMADNNGIWEESNFIIIQPIAKPNFTNLNDNQRFKIGEPIKLNFKNPLNRTLELELYKDEQLIKKYTFNGTTFTGLNEPEIIEHFYKTSSKERTTNVEYSITLYFKKEGYTIPANYKTITFVCNGSENPQFNNFGYEDNNKQVVFWTGDNQAIVKEISNFKISVPIENMMKPQKFGTADCYIFNFDGVEKTIKANETGVVEASFGAPKRAGEIEASVTAVDNRGLKTTVTKKIKVYDYFEPIIYGSAERKNQFENETNIITNGKIAELNINGVNKNIIQKVEYRYREQNGEFNNWIPLLTNAAETTFLFMNLYANLDNNKNFEIEIRATDNFKSTTISRFVNAGLSIFSIRTDGNCYVGEDKVTTNNGTWGGKTPEFNTENTTDDWVPVISGGKIQHRVISTDLNGRGTFGMNENSRHLDFNNTKRRVHLLTAESLAWWNGCYNQNQNGNYSNLEYWKYGKILGRPRTCLYVGNGTNAKRIQLSSNIRDAKKMTFYYRDSDWKYGSVSIINPNNKLITLDMLSSSDSRRTMKLSSTTYKIVDDHLELTESSVAYMNGTNNYWMVNEIYIYQIDYWNDNEYAR